MYTQELKDFLFWQYAKRLAAATMIREIQFLNQTFGGLLKSFAL